MSNIYNDAVHQNDLCLTLTALDEGLDDESDSNNVFWMDGKFSVMYARQSGDVCPHISSNILYDFFWTVLSDACM